MARLEHERGFTLIEVLIALLLVSALAAGAMTLLIKAASVIRSARLSTAAILVAAQKVEQLQAAPAAASGGQWEDYVAADGTPAPRDRAMFVRRWTVTAGGGRSGLTTVVVEADAAGGGRILALQAALPSSFPALGGAGQ